jgi:hypothetical protein
MLLSSIGNRVLRYFYTGRLTMTTGMTRAYRADVVRMHSFTQDGKELHLEIAHRLLALGHRIGEVPAILTWQETEAGAASRAKRTNWSKIGRLIASHMAFAVMRGVSRIIGPIIALLAVIIVCFGGWAIFNLIVGLPSIYLAVLTGVLTVLWVNLLAGFFLLQHTLQVQREVWVTQRILRQQASRLGLAPLTSDYYFEVYPGCAA